MTMPQQPPGWYYAQGDPPGTQRWWDGSQWVGGPVAATTAAPGFAAPGYPPPAYGAPAYAGYGAYPVRPPYSGWWRRFGGYLLDALILGIPGGIINAAVQAMVPKETDVCTDFDGDRYLCEQPTAGGTVVILLVGLALFVAGVVYYAYFNGKTGQTIGKKAVGIAVVDRYTGAPIGVGRAVGRYFGAILSGIVCGLGYLWAAWDDEKQTWHDKMVNSVVVRRDG